MKIGFRKKVNEETIIEYIEWLEQLLFKINESQQESSNHIVRSSLERKKILALALKDKWTLSKLQMRLSESKLQGVYQRNPYELILWYCCTQNEKGRTHGVDDFQRLADMLLEELQEDNEEAKYTLADIKEYLKQTGEQSEDNLLVTCQVTLRLKTEFEASDLSGEDSEEKFIKLFKKHKEQFRKNSQGIRYYFCYYVYFFIAHQILEMIDILKIFSGLSVEQSVRWLLKRKRTGAVYGQWSILERFLNDEELVEAMERYIIACEDSIPDKNRAAGIDQMDKCLLKKLQQCFVLTGTSRKPVEGSLLLGGTLSNIGNQTQIFNKNSAKHQLLCKEIEELGLHSFENFVLDKKMLYHLLFEVPQGVENSEKCGSKKRNFIGELFLGNTVSRNDLLLLLASAKGALFDEKYIKTAAMHLETNFKRLDVDRVDHILERVSYPILGMDTTYTYETFFYELFENRHFPMKLLDSFSGDYRDDFQENLLPFDAEALDYFRVEEEWYEEFLETRKKNKKRVLR